jgi:hypothetical protein
MHLTTFKMISDRVFADAARIRGSFLVRLHYPMFAQSRVPLTAKPLDFDLGCTIMAVVKDAVDPWQRDRGLVDI